MKSICRKTHIDLIKILAIMLVIFNHTGSSGFLAYQTQESIWKQIIQLFFSVFCKVAVPLFLMCSGALLMEKEESIQEIFKKRVLKYILVLVFFSLAYYVFLATHDQSSIDLNWILRTIYTSTSFSYMGSYWFLYSYIVFLLMLPFLQVLAKYITKELVKYLLILNALLTGVLPVLEFYLGLGSFAISIPIATNYVMFYPIMGYYIEKNEINYANNKKLCLTVGISKR